MNLILSLLLTLHSILNLAPEPTPKQVSVGQVFSLKLYEQVQITDSLSGAAITLTLASLNDSRCPVDVLCIQAGEVVVKLEVSDGLANPVKQLELHKPASVSLKDSAAATGLVERFNPSVRINAAYEIVFLQALPYPEVKTSSKANEVQLRVQHVPQQAKSQPN